MGRKKKVIPKDVLEKDYWENQMSIRQIANKHGIAKDTVNKLLVNYGISVRNASLSPVKSTRNI